MNSRYEIDKVDKQILKFLMSNARMTFLEIAKDVGISSAAIHQRVKKLEENGIIRGSGYIVDPKELGYDLCVFIGVFLKRAQLYRKVIDELNKIPEVVEGHFTTGKHSIFLKLYAKDNEHLMSILVDIIQNIDGIESTETFLSLEQAIERQIEV